MRPAEGIFITPDGVKLFERSWKTEAGSRAAVLIVHGFAEHSGRYFYVADELARAGYSIYMFDLRGHGQSEGSRATVNSFNEYLHDLELFLGRVKILEPDKPIFLVGHSLGGAIAALFASARQDDIKGLILSSPLVKVPEGMSSFFISILSFLSRCVPFLPLVEKVDSALISRDKDVVKRYRDDPLVHHRKMSAREADEVVKSIQRIKRGAGDISLPILLLHGTADRVADIKGTEELYELVSSKDKEMKRYEGFYHEIMNEPEKGTVISDIISWMDKHL